MQLAEPLEWAADRLQVALSQQAEALQLVALLQQAVPLRQAEPVQLEVLLLQAARRPRLVALPPRVVLLGQVSRRWHRL